MTLQVYSRGTSTVSAGAESKPHAVQVPITLADVRVSPRDIVCVDPEEGVVCIPASLVSSVLQWLKKRGSSEDSIQKMVKKGSSVQEAFAKFR